MSLVSNANLADSRVLVLWIRGYFQGKSWIEGGYAE